MSWTDLYPYKSCWFKTPFGHRLHYLDEGEGAPVVMLHGNPTWSFMYRNLILNTSKHKGRSIVPDHIGCGLSDKPQDWHYTLKNHATNLEALLNDHLKLDQMDLVVSDWGAPIGFLYAVRHPQKIRRIVVMNSTIWPSRNFPKAVYLTKIPLLGALLVRRWNLLLNKAIHSCVCHPLTHDIKKGYREPYKSYHDRIAIQRFPQDIPLTRHAASYQPFQEINVGLHSLSDKPLFLAWAEKDFCFPTSFLDQWKQHFPDAPVKTYAKTGHFLLEDAPNACQDICQFLFQD